MTIFSVIMLGWLLIIGGIMSIFHAFVERQWGGFIIDLLTGLLYVVVGFMAISNPADAALAITLIISLFLMFGGGFELSKRWPATCRTAVGCCSMVLSRWYLAL